MTVWNFFGFIEYAHYNIYWKISEDLLHKYVLFCMSLIHSTFWNKKLTVFGNKLCRFNVLREIIEFGYL